MYRNTTEVLELGSVNMNKNSKKKKLLFRTIPLIMVPTLIVLAIISFHSKSLVIVPINYIIYILLPLFVYLLVVGLFVVKKQKVRMCRAKKYLKILGSFIMILYAIGCSVFIFLLYGPYNGFRDWLISTAMSTMNHQYLCKWFYNDKEISKSLGSNYIKEVDEDTDKSLIKTTTKEEKYANEYEEQVLKRDKKAKYKIINLTINGQKAYLAAIYDPSLVKVAVTSSIGRYGQYVTKMAEDHNALLGINGGGFYDPGYNSTGGSPTGITISDGKIVTNNTYGTYSQGGGIIGMTNDNVLVLMRTTAQKAIAAGVRDAVTWGPFLIVNGKKSFIKGNGGWGYAARTAIGQRSDGIVLLLVVDSNSTRTKGADMVDLTEIMSNYGAINAANLDGGTSSVMVLPKKEALKYNSSCNDNYCYINDPINGSLKHKTRAIATSFIVAE